jgi:hypothetical protein
MEARGKDEAAAKHQMWMKQASMQFKLENGEGTGVPHED